MFMCICALIHTINKRCKIKTVQTRDDLQWHYVNHGYCDLIQHTHSKYIKDQLQLQSIPYESPSDFWMTKQPLSFFLLPVLPSYILLPLNFPLTCSIDLLVTYCGFLSVERMSMSCKPAVFLYGIPAHKLSVLKRILCNHFHFFWKLSILSDNIHMFQFNISETG